MTIQPVATRSRYVHPDGTPTRELNMLLKSLIDAINSDPDSTETLTNKTISSLTNTLDVAQVAGTTTNDTANAGNLGEYISSTVLNASAVTLTTTQNVDITSISLSAGDWDVWGSVVTKPGGGSVQTSIHGWISHTSSTLPTIPNSGAEAFLNLTFSTSAGQVIPVGTTRVSVTAATTIYLTMAVTFTNTNAGYGFLGARRRR